MCKIIIFKIKITNYKKFWFVNIMRLGDRIINVTTVSSDKDSCIIGPVNKPLCAKLLSFADP